MTIIFGTVPSNPTRRFKNWKTLSLSSVIKVKRRNLRRSLQRSNRDFGSGLLHLALVLSRASQPQQQRQRSCLLPHSGFSSGVKSRTPLPGRDGMSRAVAGTPRSGIECLREKRRRHQAWRRPNTSHRCSRLQGQHVDCRYWHRQRGTEHAVAFDRRGQRPQSACASFDRGTIHAYIWALPGEFTVDTPSAIAVDLGCSYTLEVDDSGAGLLRTKLGWVGFKLDGHEAFIPAGAVCATRPKVGPGTPYFDDASASFRESLSKFDFATGASRKSAAPNSAKIQRSLASATRSPSGICSLASANRSAVPFTTVWPRLFRLLRELRARAFCTSTKICWTPGGTSWASATFPCGARGSVPGLKPKADECLGDLRTVTRNPLQNHC